VRDDNGLASRVGSCIESDGLGGGIDGISSLKAIASTAGGSNVKSRWCLDGEELWNHHASIPNSLNIPYPRPSRSQDTANVKLNFLDFLATHRLISLRRFGI
jgi:hypothetical protein